MRISPVYFTLLALATADPCVELCRRESSVCTNGSWRKDGNICHAYMKKQDGSHCYHKEATKVDCPASLKPLTVDDAARLIAPRVHNGVVGAPDIDISFDHWRFDVCLDPKNGGEGCRSKLRIGVHKVNEGRVIEMVRDANSDMRKLLELSPELAQRVTGRLTFLPEYTGVGENGSQGINCYWYRYDEWFGSLTIEGAPVATKEMLQGFCDVLGTLLIDLERA